jgi:hypothetical protein
MCARWARHTRSVGPLWRSGRGWVGPSCDCVAPRNVGCGSWATVAPGCGRGRPNYPSCDFDGVPTAQEKKDLKEEKKDLRDPVYLSLPSS